MHTFRGSYISLTVWLLVLIFLLGAPIALMPALFIADTDVAVMVGAGLLFCIIIATILRYVLLRVEIGPDFIEKRGLFGRRRIQLTPDIAIQYRSVQFNASGGALVAVLSASVSEDSRTNHTLLIRSGDQTLQITSSVIHAGVVAAFLRKYELLHILPHLRARLERGETVDSGVIRQNVSNVFVGRKTLPKPLPAPVSVHSGVLEIPHLNGKVRTVKVKWRNIWNPYATANCLMPPAPSAISTPIPV